MNERFLKIVKAALIGWAIALGIFIILFGEYPPEFGNFMMMLTTSAAPGIIVGIMTLNFIEKGKNTTLPNSNNQTYSLETKLQGLKNLLDQGILTKEEFEEQKRKFLNEN